MKDRDTQQVDYILKHYSELKRQLDLIGDSVDEFLNNVVIQKAINFDLLQISEHINALSNEAKLKIDKNDIKGIIDTRNYVVHGYGSAKKEMIWDIIHNDLPRLIDEINNTMCGNFLETERLIVTTLKLNMAKDISLNSLDDETKKFVPDEVFETEEVASETIEYLMCQYESDDGPYVYPIIVKKTDENIGYVELVKVSDSDWEIGYHIGAKYRNNGYATEATKAFLNWACKKFNITEIYGICLKENGASIKVLEKCGLKKIFEGAAQYQGEDREILKYIWRK